MIELSERKRKMINLKIAVEDSLVSLNLIDKRILGLVFIDGVKSERVAKLLNMSLRTFFRRKTKALNNFMEEMELSGYNAEYFMKEYSQEKWFISVYNECLHKRSSEDVFSGKLFKRVINEVSQIRLPSNNFG